MVYTTFSKSYSDINNEPMFLGKNVNTFRTDIRKYSFLNNNLNDSFDYYKNDKESFNSLSDSEQSFITKILQLLISINSTQSRGISVALLQLASLPEVESFIQGFSFLKLSQLLKYNQIVNCLCRNPKAVLDDITKNKNISRISRDFGMYYDLLILDVGFLNTRGEGLYFVSGKERRVNRINIKKELFLAIVGCYGAESIKNKKNHLCLDLCSEDGTLDKTMSIIKSIETENDEIILNLRNIISTWRNNGDDPEMSDIYYKFAFDAKRIFYDIFNEEILSLEYLFDGNCELKNKVSDILRNLTEKSMLDIGFEFEF